MHHNPHSVLVVEDERRLAEVYAEWLATDYEVKVVADGETAIDILSSKYDVVLLDRRMPEVSGDEVLEFIREEALNCRVAMVTGIHPDFDILEMKIDEYVVKPVKKDELQNLVEELIRRSSFTDRLQETYQLAVKIATLEAEKSARELEENKEYRELKSEFQELTHTLDDTAEKLDNDDLIATFRDIQPN